MDSNRSETSQSEGALVGFEERFSPIGRRLRRVLRRAAWWYKGLLGLRRTILVEMRWRLGDEIMALPIYDALRARYPN